MPSVTQSSMAKAPAVDMDLFRERGFAIFPALLSDPECQALQLEIDRFEAEDIGIAAYLPCHADLVTHPILMAIADTLMEGQDYGFHHLHTARHDAGIPGLPWHHDYDQRPQTDRLRTMVHFFIYVSGLNGTIGDLLLLPGSHREVLERYALSRVLGTRDMSGMTVVDDLPSGSLVAIHSGVLHARRAKPGGETNPRYFIDASYCQAGRPWPAYRERGDWREILAALRDRDAARGGHRRMLFREDHFYE